MNGGYVRRVIMSKNFDLKKGDKIYKLNPKTINSNILAADFLKFMEDNKIKFLSVVGNNEILDVVHIHHLIETEIT